jgi:hypothetical protein
VGAWPCSGDIHFAVFSLCRSAGCSLYHLCHCQRTRAIRPCDDVASGDCGQCCCGFGNWASGLSL